MLHKHNAAARKRISDAVKVSWVTRARKGVAERFWPKVNKNGPSGCWEWTGSISKSGYGQMRVSPDTLKAHRIAWSLTRGEIPDGLILLHSCDNRKCVNPDHLRVGTYYDNTQDAIAKGRMPHLIPHKECVRGHPRIPENRYFKKGGGTGCRECRKRRSAAWYSRTKMLKGHV